MRPVEHAGVAFFDAVGYALALDALQHPGPANTDRFDVTTCAQLFIPGTDPSDLLTADGSSSFQSDYPDSEPPLKPYARAKR
jgi:hypothetical protein